MFGSGGAVGYEAAWNRFNDYDNEVLGGHYRPSAARPREILEASGGMTVDPILVIAAVEAATRRVVIGCPRHRFLILLELIF